MNGKRDYYEILGVDRGVDEQGLKSAYRKLALRYHPDRNPGDKEAEDRFKEAAEAYGVLSDPQKRNVYDRFGHQGLQGGGGFSGFDPSVFTDFSDILGDFFGFGDIFGAGGRRQRNRPARGEDVRYDLEIEFEESIRGKTVEIQVPQLETCARCHGSGGEPHDGLTTCSVCRGRGEVTYQQGFLSIRRTCSQCGGAGKIVRRPCVECKGEGHKRVERKLRVNIPPGVDNGTRVRLAGEGRPGANGGPNGDLYVFLRVKDHPIFERRDNDLYCIVPVNIAQAALGAKLDILTFDGLQTIQIPEGAQHGERIRLRGIGAPDVNGRGRGDLYVLVEVRTPSKLTREQRKLLEQLRDALPSENEPKEKGILDKVKEYFM
ncbi:MAG: molecular chaperone DnaJ [Bryobacteraceae bacterium]|nr:molecular chaperone DnaJ [Bryobacteraceae bacterium]